MHTYTCKFNIGNSHIELVTTLPVDFIMHEYLQNYFENIKKLEKKFHT